MKIGDLRHDCEICYGTRNGMRENGLSDWCDWVHDIPLCEIKELVDVDVEEYIYLARCVKDNGCTVSDCDYGGGCKSCIAKRVASNIKMVADTEKVIRKFREHRYQMDIRFFDDVIARLEKLRMYEKLDKKGLLKVTPAITNEEVWMIDYNWYHARKEERITIATVDEMFILSGWEQGLITIRFDLSCTNRMFNIRDFKKIAIPVHDVPDKEEAEKLFKVIRKTEEHKKYLDCFRSWQLDELHGFRKWN